MKTTASIIKQATTQLFAVLAVSFLFVAPITANAADRICTFKTDKARYASIKNLAEPLSFKWHTGTGQVTDFSWLHGASAVEWFPYAAQPGTVTPEINYNRVELGITTAGFESTRYTIKGYLATNIKSSNVTFAGIYEGTGTAWFVAYGKRTCVLAPK